MSRGSGPLGPTAGERHVRILEDIVPGKLWYVEWRFLSSWGPCPRCGWASGSPVELYLLQADPGKTTFCCPRCTEKTLGGGMLRELLRKPAEPLEVPPC